MDNPYESVPWDDIERLHSVNHVHTFSPNTGKDDWPRGPDNLDGQAVFESMYERGIRHFALSNYHPAKPTYPLERYVDPLPDDALGCPNGEHHSNDVSGHYCSIGSYFQSGDGYETTWDVLFDDVFSQLAYEGGGGLVINHPHRTGLDAETLIERLDYDERVLGIEAYNHRSEVKPKYNQTGDAIDLWDELLASGRQVFGFFNADSHSSWLPPPSWTDEMLGRNVLLVPERTEAAAARAYRQGQFFGALRGNGLAFERIAVRDDTLVVETNHADRITIIGDQAVVDEVPESTTRYSLTDAPDYVRVEAADDTGERIFSQAIHMAPDARR